MQNPQSPNNSLGAGAPPIRQGIPPAVAPPVAGGMPPINNTAPPAMEEKLDMEFIDFEGPISDMEDAHIDELLHIVVDLNASDLHVSAECEPVVRVDGLLKKLPYRPLTPQQTQRLMYEIIADEKIHRFETTLELDFSYALPKRARFRVNMYRDRGSVASAFRLISDKIPTVEELNLPTFIKTLVDKPRGLVLVTGPTGSGKSTSLAAMINHINTTRAQHIITIEDPIEYLHKNKKSLINQRELGQDTNSFGNALRASLREDPDVLLVGEMRDIETIGLAITAAETGHLVFATLHTNTAAESVDRMIDVFPPGQQEQIRIQLSNNLVAIISQQLLPKATGKGRVPANEIMVASPAIRNLIREAKTHQIQSHIQTSAAIGMVTMDQCLRDLYNKGWVSMEEIMSRAVNVDELKKMLVTTAMQGAGPGGRPAGRA